MKRLFLGIILLVFTSINLYSGEKEVYCYSPSSAMTLKHTDLRENPTTPFCETNIPKSVYDKIETESFAWFVKGEVKDPDSGFFSSRPLRNNPNFIQQRKTAIENIYADSNAEIVAFNKSYEMELKGNQKANERVKAEIAQAKAEKEKQLTVRELEKLYSDVCSKTNKQGSDKYNNCLLEKQTEAKRLAEKVSKMTPDDRRAFTCSDKFGFRKGSDKFKDCVFELYKVETELEKIELQKKIIEANLEATRARESAARTEQDRNTALLERQTLAQERAAAAAAQQARIANFESNERLFDRSMELLRGDRNLAGQVRQPQQRLKTDCTFTGRFMNCY